MICPYCLANAPAGRRECPSCDARLTFGIIPPFAGRLERLGAFAIDTFLFLLPLLGFAAAYRFGTTVAAFALKTGSLVLAMLLAILQVTLLFASARTTGKKLLGLMIIRRDYQPANAGRLLLREVPGRLLCTLAAGLGYLPVLWREDRCGWHDRLAGTIVVTRWRPDVHTDVREEFLRPAPRPAPAARLRPVPPSPVPVTQPVAAPPVPSPVGTSRLPEVQPAPPPAPAGLAAAPPAPGPAPAMPLIVPAEEAPAGMPGPEDAATLIMAASLDRLPELPADDATAPLRDAIDPNLLHRETVFIPAGLRQVSPAPPAGSGGRAATANACRSCGRELVRPVRFCPYCGAGQPDAWPAVAAAVAPGTPRLELVRPDGRIELFPLPQPEARIGRYRDNALAFPAEQAMSGCHCVIFREEGRFFVRDLNSYNGVYVNGRQVRFAPLQPGDELCLGTLAFRFQV